MRLITRFYATVIRHISSGKMSLSSVVIIPYSQELVGSQLNVLRSSSVLSTSRVISPWPLPDWEWLAYSLHSHKGCTRRMNKGKSPPGIVNISIGRDVPHFVKRNFKSNNNNKYCFNFQTVCIVTSFPFLYMEVSVNYWYIMECTKIL